MRISEQWLREWLPGAHASDVLIERLTMAGLEVAAVTPAAPPLKGVIVGRIEGCERHPEADALQMCRVAVGKDRVATIVCGASNARAGLKVAVATSGTALPGDKTIAIAEVRGVRSDGMLCSAAELGLAESAEGLFELGDDANPGQALSDYLQLDDKVWEIELTPNRGDCLSVLGIARELAALIGTRWRMPFTTKTGIARARGQSPIAVKLKAKAACPHYVGRGLRGLRADAVTPMWLRERLRRSGIRSIHPAVDVTNYVMLELGQPMHAFDADTLKGAIEVRLARAGEAVELLDGSKIECREGDLLIADSTGPLALAGVMGGARAGISASTTNIFFESAFFDPGVVSRQARRLGIHSESSHRFARGVDPALQTLAIERATALLQQIAGGEQQVLVDLGVVSKPAAIRLRQERVAGLLGMPISAAKVKGALTRLGMKVAVQANGWRVTPPSYRFDVRRECDLIEEVARLHGYEQIPTALPRMDMRHELTPRRLPAQRLLALLADRGYHEIISYSFVDPALQALLDPDGKGPALANPLAANMAAMRTSLWPGLISALQHNQNRQQARVRLFEVGARFGGADLYAETATLAGLLAGSSLPPQWGRAPRPVDFYDVKGDIEALFAFAGLAATFSPGTHPALHPGQTAFVSVNVSVDDNGGSRSVGVFGALHPDLLARLQITGPVFLFQCDLAPILATKVVNVAEVSRFPAIQRDLAVVLDAAVPAQRFLDTIRKVAGNLLVKLELFDDYRGEGIDSGKKSLAVSLTLQDLSRTLKEEAVEEVIAKVTAALEQEFGARLRQ